MTFDSIPASPIFERLFVAPCFDGVIVTTTEDHALVLSISQGRIPLDHLDVLGMPVQHRGAVVLVRISDLPHPNRFVS